MTRRTTYPNQKFGYLTVLEYSTENKGWKCRCNCGNITYRTIYDLKNRKMPSCGCQKGKHKIKPNKLHLKNKVFLSYKTNATKKKINFNLKFEECLELFEKNCIYCGSPPCNNNKSETRKFRKGRKNQALHQEVWFYTGIDRIDSTIGYSAGNCVPCCKICNISKNNLSMEDWKSWINRVYSKTFNDYLVMGVESSDSKQEAPKKLG
jgi:hypothetical protein